MVSAALGTAPLFVIVATSLNIRPHEAQAQQSAVKA